MTDNSRPAAEYAALRATIRQRGTVRILLLPLVVSAWAAILVATSVIPSVPLGALVPLLVLAAGFEAIYALHMNVERIGRYLQTFHEASGGWEQVTMEYGRRYAAGGGDPLFAGLFLLAIGVNFIPAALGGTPLELALLAVLHLLLINRIRLARSTAANQRQIDLERFTTLQSELPVPGLGHGNPASTRGRTRPASAD